MRMHRGVVVLVWGLLMLCQGAVASGENADPAHGLWLAAQKDGVIEFKPCTEEPAALCGSIVWDKDARADRPGECGRRIVKLRRREGGVWRDGWVYDPREEKNYKGAVRVKESVLYLRAYIGTELLGKTEEMTRVDAVPAGCPAVPVPAK